VSWPAIRAPPADATFADFCNKIGTKRPIRNVRYPAAIGEKADLAQTSKIDVNDPERTS
jgi:hypothetical protein